MISLKILHTPFSTTTMIKPSSSRRHHFLCHPRSKPDDGPDPDSASSNAEPNTQEILAKMAMLQAEKARLTNFLDERSAYLTKFAEDANAEFDAIGESALKDLDDAASRINENIEKRMLEFEESARENKMEMEKSEKELAEFEGEVQRSRNQGMFFQSFSSATPLDEADREKAKEEAERISEVTKRNAASKTRKNIYVALIGVVVIGISDSLFGSSGVQDWRKIGILGVILVGLVSQFVYEQSLQSDVEKEGSDSSSVKEDDID